jgi:DnaJ-class molecular chaperone
MQQQNFYSVLGVKKSANLKEIKTAYRLLAKKYHPDKNLWNAQSEEHFKKIHLAYTILSDLNKRRDYDLSSGFIKKNHYSGHGVPYSFSYQNTSTQTSEKYAFSDVVKDKRPLVDLFPLLVSVIIAIIFICFIMMYKL